MTDKVDLSLRDKFPESYFIYLGETEAFLPELPARYADLIIADPPYGIPKDMVFGKDVYKERDKWLIWSKIWINHAKRILKPDGNLFIYASHENACFLQTYLYELDMVYRRQIIWYYENNMSRYVKGPACMYECLLWFAKSEDSTFHTIREPYKSTERLKYACNNERGSWTPNPEGRQAGDVWRFPVLSGKRFEDEKVDHPTQKPLSISRRIVKHFSDPGNMVLVPFVGSGTECVAAKELNRRYIGVEKNPEYFKIALKRLENTKRGSLSKKEEDRGILAYV